MHSCSATWSDRHDVELGCVPAATPHDDTTLSVLPLPTLVLTCLSVSLDDSLRHLHGHPIVIEGTRGKNHHTTTTRAHLENRPAGAPFNTPANPRASELAHTRPAAEGGGGGAAPPTNGEEYGSADQEMRIRRCRRQIRRGRSRLERGPCLRGERGRWCGDFVPYDDRGEDAEAHKEAEAIERLHT